MRILIGFKDGEGVEVAIFERAEAAQREIASV
jgi:hypothetical protein